MTLPFSLIDLSIQASSIALLYLETLLPYTFLGLLHTNSFTQSVAKNQ
jgi:hypothetical protein